MNKNRISPIPFDFNQLYTQYMYSYPHKTAYRPLPCVSLKDYGRQLAGKGHGLYLHIPFCQSKCGYCNLFSVTSQGTEDVDRYLDAVERQALQYGEILKENRTGFSGVTVGGGTPLLLSEGQLDRMFAILDGCRSAGGQDLLEGGEPEWTIETAPNQTTRGKLRRLKEGGITRVSMGIQSFFDRELLILGRHHRGEKIREALDLLKTFDFPCVNLDFIYGIPGQTADSFLASLEEALVFCPDEIFLYPLYVKHGAGMEQKLREAMVLEPEKAFLQYSEASSFLRSEGFRQDSMRRFVRRRLASTESNGDDGSRRAGREFSDCGFSSSLSLGCGGRSYLGKLHFCTPYAITREGCLAQIREFEETRDYTQIRHGIFLSDEEMKRRYVIRHLLIYPGLPLESYRKRFNSQAEEDFSLLAKWKKEGFLECHRAGDERYLALTQEGLGFSDCLGPQLISSKVWQRMKEWDKWFCTGDC